MRSTDSCLSVIGAYDDTLLLLCESVRQANTSAGAVYPSDTKIINCRHDKICVKSIVLFKKKWSLAVFNVGDEDIIINNNIMVRTILLLTVSNYCLYIKEKKGG